MLSAKRASGSIARIAAEFSARPAQATVKCGSSAARARRITATWALAFASLGGVFGCGSSGSDGGSEDVAPSLESSSHTAIFGGLPDAELQSGVVALRVGEVAPYEVCSGALVAPNVVLTARHCVSRMIASTVICTDRGESANGVHVGADHDPSSIQVFTGERPDFHGASSARATALVHVVGTSLCNSDLALVVLDRAPAGVRALAVRLGKSVQPHERIRAIGYGKSDAVDDTRSAVGKRMRRDDVNVLEVGAKLTASDTALGDKEFEVGRSICQGDSGGPSISEATGAVVGVVSRGADCRQDFGHVYTQTSGFEPLFALALEKAGTAIMAEDGAFVGAQDITASLEGSGKADENSGCSVARRASASSTPRPATEGSLFLLGALALFARRRR